MDPAEPHAAPSGRNAPADTLLPLGWMAHQVTTPADVLRLASMLQLQGQAVNGGVRCTQQLLDARAPFVCGDSLTSFFLPGGLQLPLFSMEPMSQVTQMLASPEATPQLPDPGLATLLPAPAMALDFLPQRQTSADSMWLSSSFI